MQLIGLNRSPFTRRVAITLHIYGIPFKQQSPSSFANREEVRTTKPFGRIPALVLDDGKMLVDSAAIIDHLDGIYGRDRALTPAAGADRHAVLKIVGIMLAACDKGLQAAYERNHCLPEKLHQRWIDDCVAQVADALAIVDTMMDPSAPYLLLGRLTQADVTAFVAERLAREIGLNTAALAPHMRVLIAKLARMPPFLSTEP